MSSPAETSQQSGKAPRNHESIGGVLKDGRLYETIWDSDEAELHFMTHNFDGTIEKVDSILVTQTRAMIPPKNLTAALSQNVVRLASVAAKFLAKVGVSDPNKATPEQKQAARQLAKQNGWKF